MKNLLITTFSVLFLFSCSSDENEKNSTAPVLTTTNIVNLTANGASTGGNITSDGGANINARGVVWSTSQNPTIAITTKTLDGVGLGSFTSSISGLTPNTTYYVRAYATNSAGTSYGNEITFTTIVDVTTGLIAFYPFNGNANDDSGNGNNGVVNGAVSLTTDRNGNQNAAYSFPGSSSAFININQNSSFANFTDGLTLSVWYLSNISSSSGRVIALGNTDACNIGFHVSGFPNTGAVLIGSNCIGYGNWSNAINNQSTNTWNHLVFTVNLSNNQWKIFHNGQNVVSGTSTSSISLPLNLSSFPFNIGRKTVSAFDSWNGKVDDVRIYNRALNQSEVSYLFNN